jgi:outer membrane receptor for ferric coprogen and ferric-rhodotorulic acid
MGYRQIVKPTAAIPCKDPEGDEMVVVGDINYGSMTEDTGSYTTRSMSAATRLNLSPRETPQSVSVVTRQRMNDQI